VRLDGDTTALAFTPDSLVDPAALSVSDRVRCELSDRRVVIHGAAGGVPDVGDVKMTALSAARTGWLLCDGSAVSRTTYAALFAGIGTTYGVGDGSTTFNLPDMQGRVPVGRDTGQTEFDTLGETGGAKTHTLTVAQMPSHTHTQDNHTHVLAGSNGGSANLGPSVTSNSNGDFGYTLPGGRAQATRATNQNTGGGSAHNNLQPYQVLNFIIKT
jgi:microcystin-dependent protein